MVKVRKWYYMTTKVFPQRNSFFLIFTQVVSLDVSYRNNFRNVNERLNAVNLKKGIFHPLCPTFVTNLGKFRHKKRNPTG